MLPIDDVLERLLQQAQQAPTTIVQAPPGAGKTTRIPLALLTCPWLTGNIILIQPRRLAVYNAANQLAHNLGEPVGARIGYRTRFDQCVGKKLRIEVITDGLFVQRIQHDPELSGIDLVIFDEFHERSVAMDLGLAFALETQSGLRDQAHPLRLMVMSATLDGARLSDWLQGPLTQSQGRSFPVTTHYHPMAVGNFLERHIAQVIALALTEEEGDVLVFLPGMREIRRVEQQLNTLGITDTVSVRPLHGSLSTAQQQYAIQPTANGERKIVLSTNVAETSVTLEGIRIVIDSGLARVARYDERSGINRLHTEFISAASAEQRRGRAGRTQSGACYRLWAESRQQGLKAFNDPEINIVDLSSVLLEASRWGIADLHTLALLDYPEQQRLNRAQALLQSLALFDQEHRLTTLGKQVSQLSLSPRLATLICLNRAHSILPQALLSAALLSENDPCRFDSDHFQADLALRLSLLSSKTTPPSGTIGRIHTIQRQLQRQLAAIDEPHTTSTSTPPNLAQALALAFADRIAQRRSHLPSSRYLLSNGKGVQLSKNDKLAHHEYLIVLNTDGASPEPRITLACPISKTDLCSALSSLIITRETTQWNDSKNAVMATTQTQLGALILMQKTLPEPWPQASEILLQALVRRQLKDIPWSTTSLQLLARLQWLHQQNSEQWPDFSTPALIANAGSWLLPYLNEHRALSSLHRIDWLNALKSGLPWEKWNELDRAAPEFWSLPSGSQVSIDYDHPQAPLIRARLQEFYGLNHHPTLPGGQKLTLELLSPAMRPLQITQNLPTFWEGTYHDIAKEMRGRYPKHFWPNAPNEAQATNKTKKFMQNSEKDD